MALCSTQRGGVKQSWLLAVLIVALAAAILPAAPPAAPRGLIRPIKVLITYDRPPGAADEANIRARGGVVTNRFNIVPAVAATIPEAIMDLLRGDRGITRIELDVEIHATQDGPQTLTFDDELAAAWGVNHIGAGKVHPLGIVGAPIKVAIVDTGINYTHSDLADLFVGRANIGRDFVNNDTDPWDDNGHGTHVAGTVAAVRNEFGVVGVAPGVEIYALKVLGQNGSGNFSSVIAALDWCVQNGIHVSNHSYGSTANPGSAVKRAFDNAEKKGHLSVASAGNSGAGLGFRSNVSYPARYASVVAVAATDKSDNRASFSSRGSEVELSAPGVAIGSTMINGGYGELSGTSMASPHVAGVAALVFSLLDPKTGDANRNGRINDEVRSILQKSATDKGAKGRDTSFGFGLVDVPKAVARAGGPTVTATLAADDAVAPPPTGGSLLGNLLGGLRSLADGEESLVGELSSELLPEDDSEGSILRDVARALLGRR